MSEFDLIPEHVKDNYRNLVDERHGGAWSKLARQFDVDGHDLLARWAASQTLPEAPFETATDKRPRTTRGKSTG